MTRDVTRYLVVDRVIASATWTSACRTRDPPIMTPIEVSRLFVGSRKKRPRGIGRRTSTATTSTVPTVNVITASCNFGGSELFSSSSEPRQPNGLPVHQTSATATLCSGRRFGGRAQVADLRTGCLDPTDSSGVSLARQLHCSLRSRSTASCSTWERVLRPCRAAIE